MKSIKRKKYTPKWGPLIIAAIVIVLIVSSSFMGVKHLKSLMFDQINYYNDISSETISENEPSMVFIEYPVTGNDDVNTLIKKYIDTQYENFKNGLSLDGKIINEYNVSYESFPYNETIVSFFFSKYENNSGLAHGITNIDTFTFDMKTGNLLVLEDIFADELSLKNFKTLLKEDILKVAINESTEIPFLSDDQINTLLEQSLTFSLNKDSLIVYFEPYEIAPGYMSTQEIIIGLEKIKGLKFEQLNSLEPESSFGVNSGAILKDILNDEKISSLKTKKLIALTFDDGPHKILTPRLLSILREKDVLATFYVLGSRVEKEPLILKQAYDDGHAIGSHSYSHPNLSNLPKEQVISEIRRTQDIIESIIGKKPSTIRPPYGAYNDVVLENADAPIVMWSVDTLDWKHRNAKVVTEIVKSNVQDGSIILMHDIHETSIDAVSGIIDLLKDDGYIFVTVDTMLEVRQGMENSKIYYSGNK